MRWLPRHPDQLLSLRLKGVNMALFINLSKIDYYIMVNKDSFYKVKTKDILGGTMSI